MTHAKFNFNQLMLTMIFGIRASEPPPPPQAWRTTEKAGPDRVKLDSSVDRLYKSLRFCNDTLAAKDFVTDIISQGYKLPLLKYSPHRCIKKDKSVEHKIFVKQQALSRRMHIQGVITLCQSIVSGCRL